VGGAAKEAVAGYLLIDSEDSCHAAWDMFKEHYGEPFVIAKAFRKQITCMIKISP